VEQGALIDDARLTVLHTTVDAAALSQGADGYHGAVSFA